MNATISNVVLATLLMSACVGCDDDTAVASSESAVGNKSSEDGPGAADADPTAAADGADARAAADPSRGELDEGSVAPDPWEEPDNRIYPASGCSTASDAPEVAMTDADCDVRTPTACPTGSHIDFTTDSPCAACVEDNESNRTCDWAEQCFVPFLESVAATSGARFCEHDRDCSALTLEASCGPRITLALKAGLDEELVIIAQLYEEQNCSSCGSSGDVESVLRRDVARVCDRGRCTLGEVLEPWEAGALVQAPDADAPRE